MNNLLNEYEIEKKEINFSNLDKYINEVLLYLKDRINVDKIELPEELKNINLINPPILMNNNIIYNDRCYLIPFRLMNLIKENTFIYQNISIKPNMIFSKDNSIYIIDSRKIICGNINDQLLFIAKYIFSYNSKDILEKEKNIIYSTSTKEYIQRRYCSLNDPNIQKLKYNKSIEFGEFIVLDNNLKAKNNNYVEESDIPLINKNVLTKVIENNNKCDIKNKISSKQARYHSKLPNNINYNLSEEENDEKEEN